MFMGLEPNDEEQPLMCRCAILVKQFDMAVFTSDFFN